MRRIGAYCAKRFGGQAYHRKSKQGTEQHSKLIRRGEEVARQKEAQGAERQVGGLRIGAFCSQLCNTIRVHRVSYPDGKGLKRKGQQWQSHQAGRFVHRLGCYVEVRVGGSVPFPCLIALYRVKKFRLSGVVYPGELVDDVGRTFDRIL